MPSNNRGNQNQLLVPGAERVLEQFKYEIANEFGVSLGADTSARANGSTGGEITKRLIRLAQQELNR
ncbi:alpha/beta-type small acid-soluble spore protein [Domibacillus mangrovi]|uniref:Small, acid-soluble spore protein, alpha/beta type n=1 Tax=Domibacillus mangrovi TaxID=1714354 RepID=A0A1Q5P3J7_9BACI|nr:alpha/beta-type small acid-soluble spore protein [Domibacillus mangrovi]OKL36830.1 small, acid-soluble spore protein, alpha/beta type [Domibacillus mangrovi]